MKKYALKYIKEVIVVIVTAIYIVLLNLFNVSINAKIEMGEFQGITGAVELLQYKNYTALYFCCGALLLIAILAILIILRIVDWKEDVFGELGVREIVYDILTILAMCAMIGLIICFITNPILQTVIAVFTGGVGLVYWVGLT